jgi:phenylpropionate dioxygenase-like ring-hydroxylating dioxygenase large terminal subunit
VIDLSSLRRHWFALCRSSDLAARPLRRTLLGEPLVLFRAEGGRPAALADRCPHRNAPLSAGWVSDGRIVCPYHGWQFDGAGACRAVPGLCGEPAHRSRSVASFGLAEAGGLIWGSLEPAGPPPPEPPRAPGEARAIRSFTLEAGLVDALENFLDATHTHFVHAGVVRAERPRRRVTAIVRGGGDRVEAEYVGEGRQSGLVSELFGAGVDTSLGRFIAPSTVELEYRAAGSTRLLISLHYTPETERELRVFAVARGSTAPLPAWLVAAPLGLLLGMVVRQDRRILELQLLNLRRFGGERYSSTEIDIMRPHILRILRAGESGPVEPFERRVELML